MCIYLYMCYACVRKKFLYSVVYVYMYISWIFMYVRVYNVYVLEKICRLGGQSNINTVTQSLKKASMKVKR